MVRLLLQEPDVLLLDEPTNHLDAESVYWLEQHLQKYKGTVIAVTHDRYFPDNVSGWILELDRGEHAETTFGNIEDSRPKSVATTLNSTAQAATRPRVRATFAHDPRVASMMRSASTAG